MSAARRVTVRAFAKINLDLRVVGKRTDGYHELRTIFQTVSLADSLDISFARSRRTEIALQDPQAIPDNLVVRAADLALGAMEIGGHVTIRLKKHIPMGAGLGGGSSDAAAMLLALPVLAGSEIPLERLIEIGEQLGSDVPFFLFGGRAAAIGRGTELFPLPDAPRHFGILAAPGIHVSTAEAYSLLGRSLTKELHPNKIGSFQSQLWGQGSAQAGVNDFESAVFATHPELKKLKGRLLKAGASSAMMTGSGSALFGLFPDRAAADRSVELLSAPEGTAVYKISLLGRARYQLLWRRMLGRHTDGRTWPPRSRYSQ
jgi:4-diphosphocytidyl-2-C-methyl-D-erythritol kinase